jgi:hypothetical protein
LCTIADGRQMSGKSGGAQCHVSAEARRGRGVEFIVYGNSRLVVGSDRDGVSLRGPAATLPPLVPHCGPPLRSCVSRELCCGVGAICCGEHGHRLGHSEGRPNIAAKSTPSGGFRRDLNLHVGCSRRRLTRDQCLRSGTRQVKRHAGRRQADGVREWNRAAHRVATHSGLPANARHKGCAGRSCHYHGEKQPLRHRLV